MIKFESEFVRTAKCFHVILILLFFEFVLRCIEKFVVLLWPVSVTSRTNERLKKNLITRNSSGM